MKEFILSPGLKAQNVRNYRNLISPFVSFIEKPKNVNQGKLFIDENYGLVYDDYFLKSNTALYGVTDLIPNFSGDDFANYGFLRVPFRKIPRVYLNNKLELLNIISLIENNNSNLELVYRGQFSEYTINRNSDELISMYGSTDIIEPSLVTSAVRKDLKLETILPSWMAILNIYIETVLRKLKTSNFEDIRRNIVNFQSSSNFHLFSLALAQHYGLPSVGLDVTTSLDVALFFALKKFVSTGKDNYYKYVDIKDLKPSSPPVIYILASTDNQLLTYNQFKPSILPFLRPDMQEAKFMHTGWGFSKNQAATRIFMALYLNPDGDFGTIKSPIELFPKDDSFADLLNYFKTSQTNKESIFGQFLESFYMVD